MTTSHRAAAHVLYWQPLGKPILAGRLARLDRQLSTKPSLLSQQYYVTTIAGTGTGQMKNWGGFEWKKPAEGLFLECEIWEREGEGANPSPEPAGWIAGEGSRKTGSVLLVRTEETRAFVTTTSATRSPYSAQVNRYLLTQQLRNRES